MKANIDYPTMIGGADTTSPGHLVADNRWTTLHNMRPFRGSVRQVPKKVVVGGAGLPEGVQVLAALSTGTREEALLLGLTQTHAYQLRPNSAVKYVELPILPVDDVRRSLDVFDATGIAYLVNIVPGRRYLYGFGVNFANLYFDQPHVSPLTTYVLDPVTPVYPDQIIKPTTDTAMMDGGILGESVDGVMYPLEESFFTGTSFCRWSTCMYNGQIWFINPYNTLHYTDGTQIGEYLLTEQPKAKYLESFYDHIVVANYTHGAYSRPNGIMSSGLYNPSDWVSTVENEAAKIDFEEFAQPDFPSSGITGLKRMNNLLVVYMPTAIIGLRYVGLPKVYQWDPIKENCGNFFQYGLAWHGSTHYFFDAISQDFMSFSEAGVVSIGGPIVGYFGDTLSTDETLQQKTYAYCIREKQEVWWVFCSTASTGDYDKAVVFNWLTREWYTTDVDNTLCFGGRLRRAKTCDELTGTCDELVVTCDELSQVDETPIPRLWGKGDATILREETSSDAKEIVLPNGTPLLITKDMMYGAYDTVKEVDAVRIDAAYEDGCNGVEVWLSARRYVNDPVTFVKVGTWTKDIAEGRLTFAGLSGCLFRWKFLPVGSNVRNLNWSVTSYSVYDGKADK